MVEQISERNKRLLDITPILADSNIGDDWDREFGNMFHLSFDELLKLLRLLRYDVEEKLVVYLKRHLRLELAIADKLIDLQHRQLDEIGSSSLQRSVDRG